MPAAAVFDHLVVAAATLEEGEAYLEDRLGVRAAARREARRHGHAQQPGQARREGLLELIADRSGGKHAPAEPRWFALDTTALQSTLRDAAADSLGGAHDRHRGGAPGLGDRYRRGPAMTPGRVRMADHRAGRRRTSRRGACCRHSSSGPTRAIRRTRCPHSGLRLVALAGAHPQPGVIRSALAALALGETIKITYGAEPRLAPCYKRRAGRVNL